MSYELADFEAVSLSVALSGAVDAALRQHFAKDEIQEDLTFAYWRPSQGSSRYTAVLETLALPAAEERMLRGNVAFTSDYLSRVLAECPDGAGIALLHSHLCPGWQGMSNDDVVAERDRLGGLVASATGLPVVGLTWGTDGSWSGRFWLRSGRHEYSRRWASTVRVVGDRLSITFHPTLMPPPPDRASQVATVSVWGAAAQADLVRTRVGVVGLGSVGSIVAEALSRTGFEHLTFIDHDTIEERNLDRTLGAYHEDVKAGTTKVDAAKRLVEQSHTADLVDVVAIDQSLISTDGIGAALDCDVLISCVDRPWPRHVMNVMAYSHLIPVIDGGILARLNEDGRLQNVDWRVHTVGPGRPCLYCLGALLRSDPPLDRDGKLDDPDYIKNLSHADRERYQRRNVFAFSLNVASLEVLQLVGLVTGKRRVGGNGAQTYHAYPGSIEVDLETGACDPACDIERLTAKPVELLQ